MTTVYMLLWIALIYYVAKAIHAITDIYYPGPPSPEERARYRRWCNRRW